MLQLDITLSFPVLLHFLSLCSFSSLLFPAFSSVSLFDQFEKIAFLIKQYYYYYYYYSQF